MKNAKLIICVVTATLAAITPAQTQAPQAGDAVLSQSKTSFAPKAIYTLARLG
jgi:hypothetical protein